MRITIDIEPSPTNDITGIIERLAPLFLSYLQSMRSEPVPHFGPYATPEDAIAAGLPAEWFKAPGAPPMGGNAKPPSGKV